MTRLHTLRVLAILCACLTLTPAGFAQEKPVADPSALEAAKPTPYDARLMRLSEIIGSVHYLRTLCKDPDGDGWRQTMQDLLNKEAGTETERRARLTAAFNRGYRSFASVYTQCTAQAVAADGRYRAEGATLASEIIARFGN